VEVAKNIDPSLRDPHYHDNVGYWLAGFISAEGCFYVAIRSSKTSNTGYSVQLTFIIAQHSRDALLLSKIADYLGCGKYQKRSSGFAGDFIVTKFSDIYEKIIPFLQEYPIWAVKSLDYSSFLEVAKLMESRGHLTVEGLAKIRKIKEGMNKLRTDS
jgi:hypothetical protein